MNRHSVWRTRPEAVWRNPPLKCVSCGLQPSLLRLLICCTACSGRHGKRDPPFIQHFNIFLASQIIRLKFGKKKLHVACSKTWEIYWPPKKDAENGLARKVSSGNDWINMLVPMKFMYDNSIKMFKTCLHYYKIGQVLWYLNVLNDHMVKILKLQFVINYHPLHKLRKWCLFFLIILVYFKKIWWLIENRYFFHMAWNKVLDKQKNEPSGNNRWQCFKDEEIKAWITSAECQ